MQSQGSKQASLQEHEGVVEVNLEIKQVVVSGPSVVPQAFSHCDMGHGWHMWPMGVYSTEYVEHLIAVLLLVVGFRATVVGFRLQVCHVPKA